MLTVFGIPNCGTVKKARSWLDARGVDYTFVDFRKTPPPAEQVAGWVDALGSAKMRNTSGGSYRALPEDKKSWDDARWKAAFAGDPMLIKRPLIEKDGVAVLAGFRGSDDDLAATLL
ncbi:MAG: Spx/MgsR family RNA polymerase-binding regulatory protein [Deltaproteobacteria bacterium]|nr:MAG: Spx/MgsR family RNA polymerase-binding regulatory protein [Deltaproteobacteria bacterium]